MRSPEQRQRIEQILLLVLLVLVSQPAGAGPPYERRITSVPSGATIYTGPDEGRLSPMLSQTTPASLRSASWERTCVRLIKEGYFASEVKCLPAGEENQSLHFELTQTESGRREAEEDTRRAAQARERVRAAAGEGRVLTAPATATVSARSGKRLATLRLLQGRMMVDRKSALTTAPYRWRCGGQPPTASIPEATEFAAGAGTDGRTFSARGRVPVVDGAVQPFAASRTTVSTEPDLELPLPVCATLLGGSKVELEWANSTK